MERSIGPVRRVAIVAAVAITALSVVAGTVAAPPDVAGNPPLNVFVVNTPLAVTGSVEVEGSVSVTGDVGVSGTVGATQSGDWNVGASQSGNWNVGITGTPAVTSADTTTLLGSFAGDLAPNVFFEAVSFADASKSQSIRVMTNCFLGADCADITVRVYTVVNARSYLVDQFVMQNFVVAGGVYEVFGTNVTIQLINNTGALATNIGVAVFGRSN